MYTTSAIYHVIPWSPYYRNVVRTLDHSMIFVLIAGDVHTIRIKATQRRMGYTVHCGGVGGWQVLEFCWKSLRRGHHGFSASVSTLRSVGLASYP